MNLVSYVSELISAHPPNALAPCLLDTLRHALGWVTPEAPHRDWWDDGETHERDPARRGRDVGAVRDNHHCQKPDGRKCCFCMFLFHGSIIADSSGARCPILHNGERLEAGSNIPSFVLVIFASGSCGWVRSSFGAAGAGNRREQSLNNSLPNTGYRHRSSQAKPLKNRQDARPALTYELGTPSRRQAINARCSSSHRIFARLNAHAMTVRSHRPERGAAKGGYALPGGHSLTRVVTRVRRTSPESTVPLPAVPRCRRPSPQSEQDAA